MEIRPVCSLGDRKPAAKQKGRTQTTICALDKGGFIMNNEGYHRGLNPGPNAYKAFALPTELW